MGSETLTPEQGIAGQSRQSVELEQAVVVPWPRRLDAAKVRLLVGLAGLFTTYAILFLTAWAVVPSLIPGWRSVVITSGSMAPYIETGDVVVAVQSDGLGLAPGTVILISDPALPGLTTHRIVDVGSDGSYVTGGDANVRADSTPVLPEHVIGVGRILVPHVGLPLVWFRNGAWLRVVVWGLFVISSLWLARFSYQPSPRREGTLQSESV